MLLILCIVHYLGTYFLLCYSHLFLLQSKFEFINSVEMLKKSKKEKVLVLTKEEPVKKVLIGDTTYAGLGKASWESIYNLLQAKDLEVIEEEKGTTDSTDKLQNTFKDLAYSFLHRIATRTRILPYNDLVRWVIESINITDRAFFTADGRMFGLFREEDIKNMYHFAGPEKHYKKAFIKAFSKQNDVESDPIKQWRYYPKKHKHESLGIYFVDSLASPHCYVGAMICRLFGVSESARFSIEIVPLTEAVVNSYIMDWETILFDRMANHILDYRRNNFVTTRVIPRFT